MRKKRKEKTTYFNRTCEYGSYSRAEGTPRTVCKFQRISATETSKTQRYVQHKPSNARTYMCSS